MSAKQKGCNINTLPTAMYAVEIVDVDGVLRAYPNDTHGGSGELPALILQNPFPLRQLGTATFQHSGAFFLVAGLGLDLLFLPLHLSSHLHVFGYFGI